MKISEEAVFRWVVIVGVAGASVVAVTLLTRPLVGALLGLVLVIAAVSMRIGGWSRNGAKLVRRIYVSQTTYCIDRL